MILDVQTQMPLLNAKSKTDTTTNQPETVEVVVRLCVWGGAQSSSKSGASFTRVSHSIHWLVGTDLEFSDKSPPGLTKISFL